MVIGTRFCVGGCGVSVTRFLPKEKTEGSIPFTRSVTLADLA